MESLVSEEDREDEGYGITPACAVVCSPYRSVFF